MAAGLERASRPSLTLRQPWGLFLPLVHPAKATVSHTPTTPAAGQKRPSQKSPRRLRYP